MKDLNMPMVLVLYYSSYGHIAPMAQAVAEGARSAGAERGAPYGATTIAGGDGSRRPSATELDGARYLGRHVAEIAAKVAA